MSDFIIQGETLTGLGDQVRRIINTSSAFTPGQMVSKAEKLSLLKFENVVIMPNQIGWSVSSGAFENLGSHFSKKEV